MNEYKTFRDNSLSSWTEQRRLKMKAFFVVVVLLFSCTNAKPNSYMLTCKSKKRINELTLILELLFCCSNKTHHQSSSKLCLNQCGACFFSLFCFNFVRVLCCSQIFRSSFQDERTWWVLTCCRLLHRYKCERKCELIHSNAKIKSPRKCFFKKSIAILWKYNCLIQPNICSRPDYLLIFMAFWYISYYLFEVSYNL